MLLSRLIRGIALTDQIGRDVEITSLTCDSRTVSPGGLFAAFRGEKTDGTQFIQEALDRGAAAVLCAQPPDRPGPWLLTSDPRGAFGQMAANWFGRPGERMTLVGVTGTNGKTTTTYLLKGVLEAVCQTKVGLIGTNQNMIGTQVIPTERTTPESFELQALFAQMRDAGCTHVVMEVSSHALVLDRVYGVHYAVGIFTNLTQDHLDFHKTMEAYCDAKALLFSRCDVGVYNADDPWAPRLMQNATCRKFSYGEKAEADLRAENIHLGSEGITFDAVVSLEISDEEIVERMGGRRVCASCGAPFHVKNLPPKVEGVCDACGGKLEARADDKPEVVRDRLKVYHKETAPLKDFYAARNLLKTVENQPTVAETTTAILKALGL